MLDLKMLLAKILERISPMNYSFGEVATNENITATTERTIQTIRHVSKTGRINVRISHALYTSRFTSSSNIYVNGTYVSTRATNVQPSPNINVCDRVYHDVVVDVPKNLESVIEIKLAGQDSGTTATIPAYRKGTYIIADVL